jgi:hypothetical protein
MTLGDGLFAYLCSTLSVGDRVYPLTLPQGQGCAEMSTMVIIIH